MKVYTTKEICKILKISKSAYIRYEKTKKFPKAERDGRGWRYFTKKDIKKLKAILRKIRPGV